MAFNILWLKFFLSFGALCWFLELPKHNTYKTKLKYGAEFERKTFTGPVSIGNLGVKDTWVTEVGLQGSLEKPQLTPQAEAGIVPDPGEELGKYTLTSVSHWTQAALKKRMWLWAHCSL